MKSALGSTGTSVPASHVVSSGVMTMAASVEAVVIMMLSPISPLAMYATMLLAVPPGQLERTHMPTASAGSRPMYLHGMGVSGDERVRCGVPPTLMKL